MIAARLREDPTATDLVLEAEHPGISRRCSG